MSVTAVFIQSDRLLHISVDPDLHSGMLLENRNLKVKSFSLFFVTFAAAILHTLILDDTRTVYKILLKTINDLALRCLLLE